MDFAKDLQKICPVQGNLDPKRLIVGGTALDDAVDTILQGLSAGPLIFNLGHGIHPGIKPDHAGAMIEAVHELSRPYHQ